MLDIGSWVQSFWIWDLRCIVPLKKIEYGVNGDFTITYPKPMFYLLNKGDFKAVELDLIYPYLLVAVNK